MEDTPRPLRQSPRARGDVDGTILLRAVTVVEAMTEAMAEAVIQVDMDMDTTTVTVTEAVTEMDMDTDTEAVI